MNEKKVVEIKLEDILPNRFQPRLKFNESAIQELADSIKEHGVIQPIVVRKIADKYEIIAGERRYKASVMAGKLTIPAIITDLNDNESAEVALIENVQRQNLTPIEEAISYKKILDMGYLTQDTLAGKLGKTQSTVANKLRLLNLEEEVQEALLNGQISERHARSLLKISGKDQVDLLNRIIKERLTVRATDLEVEKILHPKHLVEQEDNKMMIDDPVKDETPKFDFEKFINETMKNEENVSLNIPTDPIIEDEKDVSNIEESLPILENKIEDNNELEEFTPIPITPLKLDESGNLNTKDGEEFTPSPLNIEKINDNDDNFINTFDNNDYQTNEENNNKFFNFDLIQDEDDTEKNLEVENDEINKNEENSFNYNESPFTFSPILTQNQEKINNENEEHLSNIDVKTIEPIIFEPLNKDELITPTVRFDGIKYNPNSEVKENSSSDIRTVINTVRSCAETVKKFGYKVDVHEIDFENTYQITFEIHKN